LIYLLLYLSKNNSVSVVFVFVGFAKVR